MLPMVLTTQDRISRDTLPLTHEFLPEMLGFNVRRSASSPVRLQSAGLIRQGRGG